MSEISNSDQKKPMFYEAVALLESRGLDLDDAAEIEKTRVYLCTRELDRRMQPWRNALVNAWATRRLGEPLSPSDELAIAMVREMTILEMRALGLESSDLPEGQPG